MPCCTRTNRPRRGAWWRWYQECAAASHHKNLQPRFRKIRSNAGVSDRVIVLLVVSTYNMRGWYLCCELPSRVWLVGNTSISSGRCRRFSGAFVEVCATPPCSVSLVPLVSPKLHVWGKLVEWPLSGEADMSQRWPRLGAFPTPNGWRCQVCVTDS